MKETIRKVFFPILKPFESGEGEYSYKPSHRTILVIVGSLFLFLSGVCAVIVIKSSQLGGAIPFLVFFLVGFVSVIVGALGSDRAVAKIWGNK